MNNSNNSSNTNKSVVTNTKIIQFYNPTAGEDSSTISLGFWKDYVSFNINPILPEEERVNGKVYNYEKTASCLLGIENVYQLYMGVKLLEKSIKEKSNKITSIAVKNPSSKVILKIGCAGEYEGIDDYYLALLSSNENGDVDGEAFYIFTKPVEGLMINFNESDGNFKNRTINAQWELFKKFLEYAVETLIQGSVHGTNSFNNFKFAKIESMIENIGSNPSRSTNNNRVSGFSGTRRRRNSISSSLIDEENNDIDDIDRDAMFDEIENDSEFDVNLDDNEEEVVKPVAKKSSKKSSKKVTKKVSIDDIANDIISDDLDELDDID